MSRAHAVEFLLLARRYVSFGSETADALSNRDDLL